MDRRHHEQQSEQMWCLTVATNAIVTWTTEYYGLADTAAPARRARARPTHGIAHEDALHAMLHAVHAELGFEAARPPANLAPDLSIGPQRHASAPLLGVIARRMEKR